MEKDSGATTCMDHFSTSSDHQGKFILNPFVGVCLYTYLSKSFMVGSSFFWFFERINMSILVLQNDVVVCSTWYWLLFCLQVIEA